MTPVKTRRRNMAGAIRAIAADESVIFFGAILYGEW